MKMYNIDDQLICEKEGFSLFKIHKEYIIENVLSIPSGEYYKIKGLNPYFSKDVLNKYFRKK